MTHDPPDVVEPSVSSRRLQLVLVVALGAILRLIWLDGVPPGINQDEAIHAYDAYCLLQTGMDHAGVRWPIFVHANGVFESHSAPFIYLLIPFQAILGMNVWSTRLPSALLGTLTVPLVYSLVRRWYGHRAAILAALFLAISPWHIHLSRLAFEVSICPFLFTLGLWLFARAAAPDRENAQTPRVSTFLELAFAGLVFGLTAWTYNAMRVFVPLVMLAGAVIYFRRLRDFARCRRGGMVIAIFVLGLFIGVGPFIWACIWTPQQGWGRAGANFILNQSSSVGAAMASFIRTYAMHFGPSFLFVSGDPSPVQSVPGHGQLYFVDALLVPLGLYRLCRRRRAEPVGVFLMAWLLLAPIPASLTKLDDGHALRSAAALPAYPVVSALGLQLLLVGAHRRSAALGRTALGLSAVVVTVLAARFSIMFFVSYHRIVAPIFGAEYRPMIAEIQRRESPYDLVILTSEGCGQVGMLYLFWSRMPPQVFFDSPKNIWVGPEWESILQVGKFLFVPSTNLREAVAQLPPQIVRPRVLVAERPGILVPGSEIMRVAHPNGRTALILYDVRIDRAH